MRKILALFICLLFSLCAFAQQWVDVVSLKNGSVIRGTILEQIPGESLKIQTADGSLFVFKMGEIKSITKDQVSGAVQSPNSTFSSSPSFGNGRMEYSRGDFSLNGKELTENEIRQLVGDEIYTQTYESAVKQRKLGKVLTISGGAAAGGGLIIMAIGVLGSTLFVTDTYYYNPNNPSQTWGHTYSYDDNLDEMIPVITAGYLLMGAGLTALSAGIPLSIIGNKRLDWIASDYNQRSGYHATLSWGFNRYGVGLALKF